MKELTITNGDTMGERIRRIGQIRTDFFYFLLEIRAFCQKKSVRIRPIRLIRSPIVSLFFKAEITILIFLHS
jgi:hypothetical protein